MKIKIVISLMLSMTAAVLAGDYQLTSPDGEIQVSIQLKEKIYYSVTYKGQRVMQASPLTLTINGKKLGAAPKVVEVAEQSVDQNLNTVWGRRTVIRDHYNELVLNCSANYSVEFRAYDTGVAYRFVTKIGKKEVIVNNEEVAFRFDFGVSAWMLDSPSYETNFKKVSLDVEEITNFNNALNKIFLPVFVEPKPGIKVAITEAGLEEYPSLFLDRGNDYENFLLGTFEHYALTTKTGGFSNYSKVADKKADFIAKTSGKRNYPWRLMIISDDDRVFADTDLVWQLSRPNALKETDWIKPGKVAWEWWHDYAVEGETFRGGVNTETYLHHIDFAAEYNLEYIIIDWLWTDKYDLTLFNPDVDLRKITDHGKEKGVGVIVWCPGHTIHRQREKALDLFASYGVKGIKADFFGREDQTCNRMYTEIAEATAKRKMLVDFHGCAKPTGLSRTYPNIINYEAVAGNEWNKLSGDKITLKHRVLLPFTRSLQGPMDFTPGGMRNVQSGHVIRYTLPLVHGSRSGEIAMFVLYNEPLKMLCDAPSVYEKEPKIMKLISRIPTVWDETRVLQGKFGEYISTARKSGETWYVAGLNGETPRIIEMDFSFLGEGNYKGLLLKDGPNSDRIGTDYLMETLKITEDSRLLLNMVQGGGFVLELNKL